LKIAYFLPRDTRSTKRGIAIVSRPSFRPSVCLSVCLSVRNVAVPWAQIPDSRFQTGWAACAAQRLRPQHWPISHPQNISSKYWQE